MAMMNNAAKTTDEYLNGLPQNVRAVLEKLRQAIKAAAPKAEEVISYGMPGYKYRGMLVYFAAFKNHCSFFPGSSQIVKRYDELKDYKTSKGTIQFTVDQPLPMDLVKKIVKARVLENEAKFSARQISKSLKKGAEVSGKKVKTTSSKEVEQVLENSEEAKKK